jgi:2-polyprenyl-3-methyl-5-hydroxy-6-metoxy-1,4-benzoquinol methylase
MFGNVLDVGSGKWTLPRELLEHQCQYTSTDCFEDPNIDVVCDILELKNFFPKNEYDFVLCFEVLEHVSHPWLAVKQLFEILKPGGTLLLTTPFNFRFHGNNVYRDFWRFTPEGLPMPLRRSETD